MAGAVAAAGLRVVESSKTRSDFPLAYLVKHGLSAAGLPCDWVPAIRRPAVALKLGNLITVARREGVAAAAID